MLFLSDADAGMECYNISFSRGYPIGTESNHFQNRQGFIADDGYDISMISTSDYHILFYCCYSTDNYYTNMDVHNQDDKVQREDFNEGLMLK